MTERRFAKVVERPRARQTAGTLVGETVPQPGRLAPLVSNPNSCQGDGVPPPTRSARTGGVRYMRGAEGPCPSPTNHIRSALMSARPGSM
jgi:hypothetical protein